MSSRSVLAFASAAFTLVVLTGCPKEHGGGGGPGPAVSNRCEVDLGATGLFSQVGSGAKAHVIASPDELIGGQAADGRVGDVMLENDRIRVLISQPQRNFSPTPFGGWITDADLKRPAGEMGHDQFGKLAVFYAFGRTINADTVEVLNDGGGGGMAVVAATGKDALNDFVDLPKVIHDYLPASVNLVVDANIPIPLKATTYYVLSPGESRVRVLTAFCNEGNTVVSIPLGDLMDQGGTTEFFNPSGCAGGPGNANCLIDPSHGVGWQGDGVAYGYRGYKAESPGTPADDAVLNVDGVVGVLAGAQDSQGMLTWVDPSATKRPGAFGIKPGESRTWLRDFFVTRDLAEFTGGLLTLDGLQQGRVKVTVKDQNGMPAAGAHVAIVGGDSRMVTMMVTDADGQSHADVAPGTYNLYAGELGAAIQPATQAMVGTNGTTELTLTLGASRALTVHVKDPSGAPMPGKVTVLCPSGTCPTPYASYGRMMQVEKVPTNVAAVAFVPPSGVVTIPVGPGAYEVVVTRGPEYSAFPDTWPTAGFPVDLSTADQNVDATLAHVVDTSGWASADLHVHAVNSADSSVANDVRALSFLGEGVDILVSTDHDYLTDYGPVVKRLGGENVMATMVGSEISTFDFGHFNAYPMVLRDESRGGPFDWAGGAEGATLRPSQMFAGVHDQHPGSVVQVNHGRGSMGVMTKVRIDTDTFATHEDPAVLRMDPAPGATANDTKLMDGSFDAFEVANGLTASIPLLNDWMTMLSAGRRKTATAVSDSHEALEVLGGYSRTFVQYAGADDVTKFDGKVFAQAVKDGRAIGTNGPFVTLSARKVDAGTGMPSGDPVGIGGTLSVNAAAGEEVELTVDVQTPAWFGFDTIEVYTHADGREALNGESNSDWKPVALQADGSPASVKLDAATLPVEAVPGIPGPTTYNRHHVVQTFTLKPAADAWYVVIVKSSSAVPTEYPLAYDGVDCNGNLCTAKAARAYAFTNAVFVDADGSGAYDAFPQKMSKRLHAPASQKTETFSGPTVPTLEQFNAALRKMVSPHCHE